MTCNNPVSRCKLLVSPSALSMRKLIQCGQWRFLQRRTTIGPKHNDFKSSTRLKKLSVLLIGYLNASIINLIEGKTPIFLNPFSVHISP
ncbi:hypothetical protein SAMN03159290_02137 [Pseudomonas sp. NFACC13-1]|nr:hypothetical protein SAMN03159290_02137 [Pseudomonas sp. NFACC13-1]